MRPLDRILLLVFALSIALTRGAAADVGSLELVYVPFRSGDFARLEATFADFARTRERTWNGFSALSRSYLRLGEMLDDDESLLSQLDAWSAAFPQSPHPHLVRGRYLLRAARRSRGGGWGHQVPEQGMALYVQRCREASASFERARGLSPAATPDAVAGLFEAAKAYGMPRAERDRLLAAALAVDPNHVAAHEALLGLVSPHWHGSLEEMWSLARAAAKKADAEPRLGLLVVRVHAFEAYEAPDYDDHLRQPAVWQEMSAAWLRFLERQPKANQVWEDFAYHAWRVRDLALARRALPETQGHWSRNVWRNEAQYRKAWAWALGGTPPAPPAAPGG